MDMDIAGHCTDYGGIFNVEHGVCQQGEITRDSRNSIVLNGKCGREYCIARGYTGQSAIILLLFYQAPDVCPITTFTLSQVQDLLKEDGTFGDKASFVSISFDPKVDTREKIKTFADRFHADYSGWYFLRGDMDQTKKFAKESFQILIEGENKDDFAHMNMIGLVDENNQSRQGI